MSAEHPDGWCVGDRVEVASVRYQNRAARGYIIGFCDELGGVHVDLEYDEKCMAAPSELTRIDDFDLT